MSFKIFIQRAITNPLTDGDLAEGFGPRRQTIWEGRDPESRQQHQDVLAPDVYTGGREREG